MGLERDIIPSPSNYQSIISKVLIPRLKEGLDKVGSCVV